MKCLALPRRSPNWNALAEWWVRSVSDECLDNLIGESYLRRALSQCTEHYDRERNPGPGKCSIVPRRRRVPSAVGRLDSMSRAPRWPSQVLLLKGRMDFLTMREFALSILSRSRALGSTRSFRQRQSLMAKVYDRLLRVRRCALRRFDEYFHQP